MSFSMNDVSGEEWARRVRRLGAQERERRLQAVNVLLGQPDDLCAVLESELYVLREQLQSRPAEAVVPGLPAVIRPASPAEQAVISAARAVCLCGGVHEDGTGICPSVAVRMKAYLAAHPGQQFAFDDETGIFALIIEHPPGAPEVIASADDLTGLLDRAGVPRAEELS